MDYKDAYETLRTFVNEEEFQGDELVRGMFKDVDELIKEDNKQINNGLPRSHKKGDKSHG